MRMTVLLLSIVMILAIRVHVLFMHGTCFDSKDSKNELP